jgi:hypothetical protein
MALALPAWRKRQTSSWPGAPCTIARSPTLRRRRSGSQGHVRRNMQSSALATKVFTELLRRVSDIREDEDTSVPLMWFTRDTKVGRRLKTKSSERVVPVHPQLVNLGFLKYVAARRAPAPHHFFGAICSADRFAAASSRQRISQLFVWCRFGEAYPESRGGSCGRPCCGP